MEIQKLNNQKIQWQQLTAKEILEFQKEGQDVPSEYQKWAAAISASLSVQDEVTYEMVNGETDIAALEAALGKEDLQVGAVEKPNESENNLGNESEDAEREATPFVVNDGTPDAPPTRGPDETEDVTLADTTLTTDFNEIIRRKQRKGLS